MRWAPICITALACVANAAPTRNAADSFNRIFRAFSPAAAAIRSPTDLNLQDPEWQPPPAVRKVHAELAPLLPEIREAAAIQTCDFRVPLELGPDALLTHVSHMATIRGLLAVDARLAIDAGRMDEAAADVVAGLRTVRLLAGDQILVSSLSAKKNFTRFVAIVHYAIVIDATTPEFMRRIRAEALAFDPGDPFQIVAAVRSEGRFMPDWFVREFAPTVPIAERHRRAIAWDNETGGDNPDFVRAADRGEVPDQARRMSEYYELVADALEGPNPAVDVSKLDERKRAGEFGPLAQRYAFGADVAAHELLESRPMLAMLRALVGAETPVNVAPDSQ